MTALEQLEDIWESIKNRGYYIIGFLILILVPYILQAADFPPIPVISTLYDIGRESNLFDTNAFVLRVITVGALYAIFAASWDFLSGYTGQFNFGHAIFIDQDLL